jgi:hypothetical protein
MKRAYVQRISHLAASVTEKSENNSRLELRSDILALDVTEAIFLECFDRENSFRDF